MLIVFIKLLCCVYEKHCMFYDVCFHFLNPQNAHFFILTYRLLFTLVTEVWVSHYMVIKQFKYWWKKQDPSLMTMAACGYGCAEHWIQVQVVYCINIETAGIGSYNFPAINGTGRNIFHEFTKLSSWCKIKGHYNDRFCYNWLHWMLTVWQHYEGELRKCTEWLMTLMVADDLVIYRYQAIRNHQF